MRGPMKGDRQEQFPLELLQKTDSDRYEYFKNKKISHELLRRAEGEFSAAIASAEPDRLIFGYGPTGVGKTTLAETVVRKIIEALLEILKSDLGVLPGLRVELVAPMGGTFSWAEGLREALRCMKEPLIDFKIAPRDFVAGIDIPGSDRSNARRYLYAYEKAMAHRRPRIIIFDEAQYLGRVPPKRLTNQLDVVKCLAVRTRVPHALLGTYDLLSLRNLSGQISRRSVDVHFRRYMNTEQELKWFSNAVYTFQVNLPVDRCQDLQPYVDYLLEGSVGCVGNLKTWLERSLRLALGKGGNELTIDDVRSVAWSKAQLSKLFAETLEGEGRLEADGGQYEAQRIRLWPGGAAERNGGKAENAQRDKRGNRTPGKRKPCRDEIGRGRLPQAAA